MYLDRPLRCLYATLPDVHQKWIFGQLRYHCYRNQRKSGLKQKRVVCWKKQEVSGMLATHWNELSLLALPLLALKFNYLNLWLNN